MAMKTGEHFEMSYTDLTPEMRAEIEKHFPGLNGTTKVLMFSCHKVCYGHKETAEKAAVAMQNKTGDFYDAYECISCQAWHVGHSRRR